MYSSSDSASSEWFNYFWKSFNFIKEYNLSSGLWNYENIIIMLEGLVLPYFLQLSIYNAYMQIYIAIIQYLEFTSLKCPTRIPSDSISSTIFFQTAILTLFLVVYFSHIQNCIQLVITLFTSNNMQMNSLPWTGEF